MTYAVRVLLARHYIELSENCRAAIECTVYGTALGDLQEPLDLGFVDCAGDDDVAPDEVDFGTAFLLALRAVAGMDAFVAEFHPH